MQDQQPDSGTSTGHDEPPIDYRPYATNRRRKASKSGRLGRWSLLNQIKLATELRVTFNSPLRKTVLFLIFVFHPNRARLDLM